MYSLNSPPIKSNLATRLRSLFKGTESIGDSLEFQPYDKYKEIVASLPLLVCIKDREGKYVMVNQAFCDLLGMSESKIIGKNDVDLGLFLNPEQIIDADNQVFNTGQKKYIPLEPFTDRFGSLYWFQTSKLPLIDDQGEVNEILIISSDITKKIEVEQRLTKSELRYKSIFENNYSGIIVVDNELNIHNKNNSFNKLIRSTDKGLSKDDLKKYINDEDKSDLIDLMMGLVSRNYEYFDLNMSLTALDNRQVDTVCFVRGLYNEMGAFTEAVITFQDITEEIKSRKALKESETRFRIIVENATEALLLLDFESKKYIDTNKNSEELFGYTRSEILNLKLGALSPINQTSGSSSSALSNTYMEQAVNGKNVIYEWIVRRKDGKLIPCEVRLVKLPYPDKTIIRTSVIDITERKKAEHLLNAEKRKLEDTNTELVNLNHMLEEQTNQLQEFAYISSHNLRSPAGNIRALLDFYNSDPSSENLDLLLEKLEVVSIDLMDTINDLADVVRIKNEISKEVDDLFIPKLIDKARESLSQQIKSKKAVINVDLNSIERIKASKTYMESIFLNLISNALKYSDKNRPPIISIKAVVEDQKLKITFHDNGLGIDLEKYGSKMFGLRKTFHRNRDSRGVGLFITKAQIEAMGGDINVESEPNVGSKFIITLPKEMVI
jgi:PAS domain S-box-containing protein